MVEDKPKAEPKKVKFKNTGENVVSWNAAYFVKDPKGNILKHKNNWKHIRAGETYETADKAEIQQLRTLILKSKVDKEEVRIGLVELK